MEVSQLMEKSESGLYRILCQLREAGQPLSIKELCQKTGLSRATVLKYLDYYHSKLALQEWMGELVLHEDSCQWNPSQDGEWAIVVEKCLASSIKYHILLHLLERGSFSIQQLSQQLLVSEATFHRHLAGLNELLAEFDCGIYNGQWKGPEHQIRYFYWLLLSQTWRIDQMEGLLDRNEFQKEVQVVERLCQVTFAPENQQAIRLWYLISHKRWTKTKKDTAQLAALLSPYQTNAFFQRLEKTSLRFLSRYAVELDETEAHNLFAFLVSMPVLPTHTMSFLLGFGGPVSDQMTEIIQLLRIEGICGQHLPQEVTEVLGRVLHQAYFFKGTLWLFPEEYDVKRAYFIDFIGEKQLTLLDQLLPEDVSDDLRGELRWHLLSLLAFLNKPSQETLRIGLDIGGGPFVFVMIKDSLEESLAYNRLVELLPYEVGKQYDALLTNQSFQQQVACPIYRFSGPLREKDKKAVTGWLKDLLFAKQSPLIPSFPSY